MSLNIAPRMNVMTPIELTASIALQRRSGLTTPGAAPRARWPSAEIVAVAATEARIATAAPITTRNESAFPRTMRRSACKMPVDSFLGTRQIWFSVACSSEKTALAPKTSVTMPTIVPTPRAVWCCCMSRRVPSKSSRKAGVVVRASASRRRARVSSLSPRKKPKTVVARRSSGKMEKTA